MTETPTKPAARPARGGAKKSAPAARAGRVTGGLALILATIALAGGGYLWYTLLYQRQELLATDVVGGLQQLEQENRELRETLAALEQETTALRETSDTLAGGVERIQNDLARNRADWLLAEAEQLLVVANHRLQLARDVGSALAALRAADRQLTLTGNPNLLPVRRELAREIAQLEGFERADVPGMSLKLANLAEQLERVPLAVAPKPPEAAAAGARPDGWRALTRGLWADMQGLVRVRYQAEGQKPLLAPDQQYFLRENLRLMLYGAQHALLQGNVALYRQNLKAAIRWVREYYDLTSQVTAAMLADLERLEGARVAGALPGISGSLELLRQVSGRRGGA
jgi:uncharacterized protein HemX